MPVIGSMDPATKRIYLATGVVSYHPVEDIYQEVRALRRTDETLRKYAVMVTAAGNVPKGGGTFTPRYIVLQNGWRIVPEDVSHTLSITGEQLTAEGGAGSACMDLTPLSATSKVVIHYAPPAAEVIEVVTSGGDPAAIADAVWDEALAGHTTAGTAGKAMADASPAAIAAAVRTNLDTELGRVDAAVSSRSSHSPADVHAELTELANLDAAVSSRVSTADGDAMATVMALVLKHLQNRLEVDIDAQQLVLYDDNGTSVLQRWNLATKGGELVTTSTGIQTKRSAPVGP